MTKLIVPFRNFVNAHKNGIESLAGKAEECVKWQIICFGLSTILLGTTRTHNMHNTPITAEQRYPATLFVPKVLHVTTFTVFCTSASVTLCSTYLMTVFCYHTVSARASSFLSLLLVYQDATFQTILVLPHHASPETCPVQRRKLFYCVTGNIH